MEYDIFTSISPTEALAAIMGGERYDAILCDLMMPRLTGEQVHAGLAAHCGEQARRMVFVTGGATQDAHEAFLRSTSQPCLYKPFNVDEVRLVVRGMVREPNHPGRR